MIDLFFVDFLTMMKCHFLQISQFINGAIWATTGALFVSDGNTRCIFSKGE